MDAQQNKIQEVDERLTKAIQESKNDRILLKQEITQDFRQEMTTMRQQTNASMKNIETQVAQLVKMMLDKPWGALPNTIENNPKERVNAISIKVAGDGELSCDAVIGTNVKETTSCDPTSKGKEVTSCGPNKQNEEAKGKPVTPPVTSHQFHFPKGLLT